MKILIVGQGGREAALTWSCVRDGNAVFVAPGNGGTRAAGATPLPSVASDAAVVAWCAAEKPDLVVVGPEVPLVAGLADTLTAAGHRVFGPTAAGAALEGSKAFCKAFMARHGIPTAPYAAFTDYAAAAAYILAAPHAVVVKASGLAAGKGVVVPRDVPEALAAARAMLEGRTFGDAGATVVVEQRLPGRECSVLAFTDGKTVVPLPPAADHKRAHEFDRGPNTGGMGAFAPAPYVSAAALAAITAHVLQPAVDGLAAEGVRYVGVLYAGIMLAPDGEGFHALEFNCRLGDPETQVLLPLLETPFPAIALACVDGTLAALSVKTKPGVAAVTVVVASEGYPGECAKGRALALATELADARLAHGARAGTQVFHAGTSVAVGGGGGEPQLLATGGRVLAVTSLAPSLSLAARAAYAAIDASVRLPRAVVRRDIAGPFVRPGGGARPLRVGVLGSTRGSSLAPVLAAIAAGELLGVEIAVVISNKPGAGILDKAAAAGVPGVVIEAPPAAAPGGAAASREAFEGALLAALTDARVDVVLLVGFMRVLSPAFCDRFAWRCLNVHPSLLPHFGGLMDLAVHAAVLAARRAYTGCTVHFVDAVVDAGAPLVQAAVRVEEGDTPESLKARVQAAEGPALVAALRLLAPDAPVDVLSLLRAAGGDWARVRPLPLLAELLVPAATAARVRPAAPAAAPAAPAAPGRLTYAAAGVDIDAGDALVERIKPLAKSTARPGADADLGGFGGLFDLAAAGYADPLLVSGTDGVGTKLKLAQEAGVHGTVGVDLVAMSVNDILVQGAEPLLFLDYFGCGKLDVGVAAAVIEGVAAGCRASGCALVGGETAEMPSMYPPGEYDLAGFAVGAVERARVLPRVGDIREGDAVLGLPSSGLHSNGFSLVRRVIAEYGVDIFGAPPFPSPHARLADALLVPTRLYVKALLPLLRPAPGARCLVKALAHITGGGLPDNLPRVLAPGHAAALDAAAWPVPPVFKWLATAGGGVEAREMARTFNCGVGMALVVAPGDVDAVVAAVAAAAAAAGEGDAMAAAYRIGTIVPRPAPDAPQVVITGLEEALAAA